MPYQSAVLSLHSDCQCKFHFAHGHASPTAEKESLQFFQYVTRTCCQIRSSFPMLPGEVLVQLEVIIASFLDRISFKQFMRQYHLTKLEIHAIRQAYFDVHR
jgi:hypothetical protein